MVAIAGAPYPITIAPGALDELGAIVRKVTPGNRLVILSDRNVAEVHGHGQRALNSLGQGIIYKLPPGEQIKTREHWSMLTDELLDKGFGRDTTIVALGGGVVGDLAGFIAATYMRGVPYVQVPTTLLAMVDASIGGKTGVDTRHGKNLVGAFHQPVAVVVDPTVLSTLPVEHLRAGFAEIVKHGVIADAAYFDRVSEYVGHWPMSGEQGLDQLTALIRRSIEIKLGIVSRDERESGLRKVLNFGHTIGHAIEAASEFQMLHGEAVAIGLVAEARLAERLGIAIGGTARNIEGVCRTAGLPTAVPSIPLDVLLRFTRSDKKARGGHVEYALPKCIGEMAGANHGWAIPVDDDQVREVLSV
jgi:3-dehydroquinate synthase